MDVDFKKDDQVLVRREMRNGTLIRVGSIIRINAGKDSALVHFPLDHCQAVVPLSQMEKTQSAFSGRARVQPNPAYRTISSLSR
jgi:hypothetical protein